MQLKCSTSKAERWEENNQENLKRREQEENQTNAVSVGLTELIVAPSGFVIYLSVPR